MTQTAQQLPELPNETCLYDGYEENGEVIFGYTAEQMRQYALDALAQQADAAPDAIVYERDEYTWLQCPHCEAGVRTIVKQADTAAQPVAWRYKPFDWQQDKEGKYRQINRWVLIDKPEGIDAHSSMCGAMTEPLYAAPVPAQHPEAAKPAVDAMREVAEEHAHGLALDLECILADDYQGKWYTSALNRLAAYREAMNAIHERESPTFMGEPLIATPVEAAQQEAQECNNWPCCPCDSKAGCMNKLHKDQP